VERSAVVDQYGRPWDELDSVRAQALISGAFTLESDDGIPLCGRWIENQKSEAFIAHGWRSR